MQKRDPESTIKASVLRRRFVTFATVLIEQIGPAFVPLFTWVIFYGALSLLNIPHFLGMSLHVFGFCLFVIGTVYFLYRGIKTLRIPPKPDIDRRLEQDSGLPHRPLDILDDAPPETTADDVTALWNKHRERSLRKLEQLRNSLPRATLAVADPRALRICALILLVAGIVVAGSQWQLRLVSGFIPGSAAPQTETSDRLTLWVTPPDYTKLTPIYIEDTQDTTQNSIEIPEGSIISARLSGGFFTPTLQTGVSETEFDAVDSRQFSLDLPLPEETSYITITQGLMTLIEQPVQLIEDKAPTVEILQEPDTTPTMRLRTRYHAEDDYGITVTRLRITLSEDIPEGPVIGEDIAIEDKLRSSDTRTLNGQMTPDLTDHAWAGLPVQLWIEVEDSAKQISKSEVMSLKLPERSFEHPVARKLISIRKQLAWSPFSSAHQASLELEDLLNYPEDFRDDVVVYLSIRTAMARLRHSPGLESAQAVRHLLWDTALRVEENNLALAERALQQAQQELMDALSDPDSTDQDIRQKMEAFKQAMRRYIDEMQREMAKGADPQMFGGPLDQVSELLDMKSIEEFLKHMETLSETGKRDQAMDMLSQLQQMLQDIQPNFSGSMLSQGMQKILNQMGSLETLIEQQQNLLDQTIRQSDLMENGQDYGDVQNNDADTTGEWNEGDFPEMPRTSNTEAGQIDTTQNQAEQEALRRVLGEIMLDVGDTIGEIPESMGKAEQEMRGSRDALGKNAPDRSIPYQEQTIQHLQNSLEEYSKTVQQMLEQMLGVEFNMAGTDPMGRSDELRKLLQKHDVEIPEQGEKKRIRETLKILRERSEELDRPQTELDYLDRLLEKF